MSASVLLSRSRDCSLFSYILIPPFEWVEWVDAVHRRHSPGMTLDKIRAILWMMLWGDLLHLYVYYVGCTMNVFVRKWI